MFRKADKVSIIVHLSKAMRFLAHMLKMTLSKNWNIRAPEKNRARKFQLT